MPTRNALYDPNAAADHRRHAVERKRLGELLHSYFSPRSRRGKRKRLQVQAACEFHQRACLEADGRRHATVQEYARWRFGQWTGSAKAPAVDFEALGSVAEVDRLYRSLQAEARMSAMPGLPVGQPPGMTAFSGGDLQVWRHFYGSELLSGSPDAARGARVLVTVSVRDDAVHVCFMQDWSHVGVTVPDVFVDLANLVYWEALEQAELARAGRGGVRGWLGRLVPRWCRRAALRPDWLRFYEHLPSRWRTGEEFSLVRMRFHRGRFGSPRREPYGLIPVSLGLVRRAVPPEEQTGRTGTMPNLPQD